MDIPLLLAKSTTKERILTAMKVTREHEGKDQLSSSYLMEVCLRQDIMFRVWVAVFDEMLAELVKEGSVLEKELRDDKGILLLRYALPKADNNPTN